MTDRNDLKTAKVGWLHRLRPSLPPDVYEDLVTRVLQLRMASVSLGDASFALRNATLSLLEADAPLFVETEEDKAEAIAEEEALMASLPPCYVPPKGWRCTRVGGHEGPCAAVPISPSLFDGCHEGPCVTTAAPNDSSAADSAFDAIAKLCGVPVWGYPGQIVRDVQLVIEQRDYWRRIAEAAHPHPAKGGKHLKLEPPVVTARHASAYEGVGVKESPGLPAVVHGRDGLSRDSVADAILAQVGEDVVEADFRRHIGEVEEVTGTLLLPWAKAIGIYDSDGPGGFTTMSFANAIITVEQINHLALDTMRRRYRVYCISCSEEVHEATTGTTSMITEHLRDKHGFTGEVEHEQE